MFTALVCLFLLFTGYQSVNSEIMKSIILTNPTLCNTCDKGAAVDFVPFTIDCPSDGDNEADAVSVTLALNKSKSKSCSACLAREEEKLSYGACRPPIRISSSYDARIQEGGLHALNNKVVRLAAPFTPTYLQSGYRSERPVCPHLRQCQAQDVDQQINCR